MLVVNVAVSIMGVRAGGGGGCAWAASPPFCIREQASYCAFDVQLEPATLGEKPVTATGLASYPFIVRTQQGWPNCAI